MNSGSHSLNGLHLVVGRKSSPSPFCETVVTRLVACPPLTVLLITYKLESAAPAAAGHHTRHRWQLHQPAKPCCSSTSCTSAQPSCHPPQPSCQPPQPSCHPTQPSCYASQPSCSCGQAESSPPSSPPPRSFPSPALSPFLHPEPSPSCWLRPHTSGHRNIRQWPGTRLAGCVLRVHGLQLHGPHSCECVVDSMYA